MHEFGQKSEGRLVGVLEPLVRVARHAISICEVDFAITEGLRDRDRQAALVKAGASRTMEGRHITGHAIDTAAIVAGVISWKWPLYPIIAQAFRTASLAEGVPIVWGAVWDRLLGSIDERDLNDAVHAYEGRWRKLNPLRQGGPLIDGPHFELSRAVYPVLTPVTSTPPLPGGAA